MPARRGLRLSCVDRWQVLHRAHLLRGSASPPVPGQLGGVSMLPAPGGAVQRQECGGRQLLLTATAVSFFRLSPDS